MQTLKNIFGNNSKKLSALLVYAAVLLLDKWAGIEIDEATKEQLLYAVMAYLGAQGLADIGKEKVKMEAKLKEKS